MIKNLAIKIYEQHGNSEAAIELLIEEFRKHPVILGEILRFAAKDALEDAQGYSRQIIEKENPQIPRQYKQEYQQSIRSVLGGYLNWPLAGGMLLQDATQTDLYKQMDRYCKLVGGNLCNALFCHLVATRIQPGQRVGDVFKGRKGNEALKKLHDEAMTSSMETLTEVKKLTERETVQ